jgi:hypothetical protein
MRLRVFVLAAALAVAGVAAAQQADPANGIFLIAKPDWSTRTSARPWSS